MANSFELDYYAISHQARRPNNEDHLRFFVPPAADPRAAKGAIFVLADGVGGASLGEKASEHACKVVIEEYYRSDLRTPGERLRAAFNRANREIFEFAEDSGEYTRIATTLAAAVILQDHLVVASVGDSRVYLLRGGQAEQITRDHNQAAELVRSGVLTEEEALHSSVKNKLTRSVGGDAEVAVDVFQPRKLQLGDRLLLCSDGLTRYVTRQTVQQLIEKDDVKTIAERLIDFALKGTSHEKGGADNVSVLPIEVVAKAKFTPAEAVFRGGKPRVRITGGSEPPRPAGKAAAVIATANVKLQKPKQVIPIGVGLLAVLGVISIIYFIATRIPSPIVVTIPVQVTIPTETIGAIPSATNENSINQTLVPAPSGNQTTAASPNSQEKTDTAADSAPTVIPTVQPTPTAPVTLQTGTWKCVYQMSASEPYLDNLTRKFYNEGWTSSKWGIKRIDCYAICQTRYEWEAYGCLPQTTLDTTDEHSHPIQSCGNENPWVQVSPIADIPPISPEECRLKGGKIVLVIN